MSALSKEETVKSIKLPPEQIEALMAKLDQSAAASANDKSARAHERFSCRADAVIVRIERNGLEAQRFIVPIRNISEGGISFLHGAMLHVGTKCTLYVLLEKGRSFKTNGCVVRCRHLEGMIHEVGMKFDHEVRLARSQDDGAAGR